VRARSGESPRHRVRVVVVVVVVVNESKSRRRGLAELRRIFLPRSLSLGNVAGERPALIMSLESAGSEHIRSGAIPRRLLSRE